MKAAVRTFILAAVVVLLVGCAARSHTGGAPKYLITCNGTRLALISESLDFSYPERAVTALSGCKESGSTVQRAVWLTFRSHALVQLKRYEEAANDLAMAQTLERPKRGWAVIALAALYRDAGRPEKSLEVLQKMQADDLGLTGRGTGPSMPFYYHLGWTLSELKRWPEAEDAFTKGLVYQPTYGWAYMRRALALEAQEKTDAAKADVERAVPLLKQAMDDAKPAERQTLVATMQEARWTELMKRHGFDPVTLSKAEAPRPSECDANAQSHQRGCMSK